MNVAVLGPEGTFSHEMASRLFGTNVVLLPTIRSIFQHVERGETEGLVPIENSEAGSVGPTLDGLQEYTVSIVGEAYTEIHHHLAAYQPADRLSRLYVHPQTHEQCSEFIESLGLEIIHTSSNAASVREIGKNLKAGAITSAMAARLHNVPLIATDVQNSPGNTTRFVRIAQYPQKTLRPEKCSILIDPESDRSGLLYDYLAVFARRGINLTRIESRPSRRGIGCYVFFLDFEAGDNEMDAVLALKGITRVKEFGCYPRLEVPR